MIPSSTTLVNYCYIYTQVNYMENSTSFPSQLLVIYFTVEFYKDMPFYVVIWPLPALR